MRHSFFQPSTALTFVQSFLRSFFSFPLLILFMFFTFWDFGSFQKLSPHLSRFPSSLGSPTSLYVPPELVSFSLSSCTHVEALRSTFLTSRFFFFLLPYEMRPVTGATYSSLGVRHDDLPRYIPVQRLTFPCNATKYKGHKSGGFPTPSYFIQKVFGPVFFFSFPKTHFLLYVLTLNIMTYLSYQI